MGLVFNKYLPHNAKFESNNSPNSFSRGNSTLVLLMTSFCW